MQDRINDAEHRLVDKEKENGRPTGLSVISETPAYKEEMKEEISERQGCRGLRREMTKRAALPSNLSFWTQIASCISLDAPCRASTLPLQ
jgi:hypothetical protein